MTRCFFLACNYGAWYKVWGVFIISVLFQLVIIDDSISISFKRSYDFYQL